MGYNTVALIGLNVALSQMESAAKRLAARPEVQFLATTTGRYDMFAWATFRSVGELHDFLRRDLERIPGITQSETFINLEIRRRFLG